MDVDRALLEEMDREDILGALTRLGVGDLSVVSGRRLFELQTIAAYLLDIVLVELERRNLLTFDDEGGFVMDDLRPFDMIVENVIVRRKQ